MAVVSEGKCPECGRKVSMLTSTGAKVSRCPRCGAALKTSTSTGSTLGVDSSLDRFGSQPSAVLQEKVEAKPPALAKESSDAKRAPEPKAVSTMEAEKEKEVPPKPVSEPVREEKVTIPAKAVVVEKKTEIKETATDLAKIVVEKKGSGEAPSPVADVAPVPELQATKGESLDRLDRFVTETLAEQTESEKVEEGDTPVVAEDDKPARDEEPLPAAKEDLSALAAEYAAAEDSAAETLSADLARIMAQIDKLFGPGYASKHPELMTAALQAQQSTSASAEVVKRLEGLEARLARLEALQKEGR